VESSKVRHRLRTAQKLLDQEVPTSHYPSTSTGQPKKEVESQAIIQEEGLLSKVLDQYHEVQSAQRVQVPR
jgi:hypothetical protein